MTNIQAASSIVTKSTTAVASPAKTPDFKESLRSASEPRLQQPSHSGADAKSDKKGHEEKKEQVETANPNTEAAAPQPVGAVIVPAVRQTVSESSTEGTDAASTPASFERVASTAFPVQAQVTIDSPVASGSPATNDLSATNGHPAISAASGPKEEVVPPVMTETTLVKGKKEAAPEAFKPGEQTSGTSLTDGTIHKESAGSAKTDDGSAPVSKLVPMTPVLIVDPMRVMSGADPLQNAGDAMSPAKTTVLDKQTSEVREAKPPVADDAISQTAAQVPLPRQEFVSPQPTPSVDALRSAEGSNTKVKATAGTNGNAGNKGKTSAPDLRGKHEDAKMESQSSEGTTSAQPASKMPLPVGVAELMTAQTGTNLGSETTGNAQASVTNMPSVDLSQSLTDAKTGAGENVSATPAVPGPSNLEAMATQALSSAHLVQSIHQSEMKLGMNSAEFGSISISTAVSHQVLSAQILLDHPELSRVLSSHLSTVEEKLGQAYGLQAKVEVRDGGTSSYGGSQQQEKGSSQSSRGLSSTGVGAGVSSSVVTPGVTTMAASATARLDIRI